MPHKLPQLSRTPPPAVPVEATFAKTPAVLHPMLCNAYRQKEVILVAIRPSDTDGPGRAACQQDLQEAGLTDLRDLTVRGDALLHAKGTVAQVRAALRAPSVLALRLQEGPARGVQWK